jgi:hypothetical protein
MGQGERRLFRVIIKYLATTRPDIVLKNLQYVPEFGRFDDLLVLLDTPLKQHVIEFYKKQLLEDMNTYEKTINKELNVIE